jgi:hypothetical protein
MDEPLEHVIYRVSRGKEDALTVYWAAQDEYLQAMLQPLRKVHTRFFGKTERKVLDELARKGDEKLTALEEAVRLYVDGVYDV